MATTPAPLVGARSITPSAGQQPMAGKPPAVVEGMRTAAERLLFKPIGFNRTDLRNYLTARDPLIDRKTLEQTVDAFLDVFADLGLTDGEAGTLVARAHAALNRGAGGMGDDCDDKAWPADPAQAQRQTLVELRKAYGDKLAQRLQQAQRLAARDSRFANWIASAGIGDDRAVVAALIDAAQRAQVAGQPGITNPPVQRTVVGRHTHLYGDS